MMTNSRLIVSKFHENKYKNIKCFSYGLKNNSDALIAKKVADHLNLNWGTYGLINIGLENYFFQDLKKTMIYFQIIFHVYQIMVNFF